MSVRSQLPGRWFKRSNLESGRRGIVEVIEVVVTRAFVRTAKAGVIA